MRHSWLRCLIVLMTCLVLMACASNRVRSNNPGASLPAPDTGAAAAAYKTVGEYRLGSQDLIEVSVFGVADLTKTTRINANGQISLPLVGSVMAGGRSIPELEAELARRYADSYLQNPQITVFVKEYASQRITVEGAVREPGIYPLTGKTTLVQAIAVAKGLDPLADLSGIVLLRRVDGRKMAAVYDMRALRTNQLEDPQVYADDVIIVEQSGSKTALRRFIEIVPVLGFFRLF